MLLEQSDWALRTTYLMHVSLACTLECQAHPGAGTEHLFVVTYSTFLSDLLACPRPL